MINPKYRGAALCVACALTALLAWGGRPAVAEEAAEKPEAVAPIEAEAVEAEPSVDEENGEAAPTEDAPDSGQGSIGGGIEYSAPPAQLGPREDIELIEFKDMFMGKTVYFELLDGTPWGREYYAPDGENTVFVYWDGRCLAGKWTREGGRYCFHYRNKPSCWLTYRQQSDILVESAEGMRQKVGKIVDDEPLSCEPELFGRANGLGVEQVLASLLAR